MNRMSDQDDDDSSNDSCSLFIEVTAKDPTSVPVAPSTRIPAVRLRGAATEALHLRCEHVSAHSCSRGSPLGLQL